MTATGPLILAAGEGQTIELGTVGQVFTFKVTGAQTGGALDLFELAIGPGGGPPLHVHHAHDETYRLLAGTLTIQLGAERTTATEGVVVFVPRGIPHAFRNFGDVPARMLVTMTPSAWDDLLAAVAEARAAGGDLGGGLPDAERLRPLMEKNDTELLGPPMSPA